MLHSKFRFFFVQASFGLFLIGALTGCAQQVAPSGGPPDQNPPRILTVTPEKNATNVPRDQNVVFAFSESMDHKSLERAIFLTPDPGRDVKYKWKGDKLYIEFPDSLAENRTYVITLGTALKDAHGNPLDQSYTLAFSTGDEISNGQISGTVYDKKSVQGMLLWAYILEQSREIDPTKRAGDYATQTDGRGNYKLTNLSEGTYRLFAIRDSDNNRFYEPGVDDIGVTSSDIELSAEQLSASDVNFRMAARDTLGPALISAAAVDQHHVKLKFDEPLREAGADSLSNYLITVKEKSSRDTLGIRLAYFNQPDSVGIALVTDAQSPKVDYEVEVRNLTDRSGNPIDPKFNRAEFVGSALSDSLRPTIVKTVPADSSSAVMRNSPIELYFSEAMNRASFENHFEVSSPSEPAVTGSLIWETPAFVRFVPGATLQSRTNYLVTVQLDSVFDLFGNAAGDSTFKLHFTTLNVDTLSSISGTVVDPDPTGQGAIYLQASQTQKDGQKYQVEIQAPGPYLFSDILPGLYLIKGFRDRDGNGAYSFGSAFPFVPAERFVVYPDSIKVRSRWPNEGNDITFTK